MTSIVGLLVVLGLTLGPLAPAATATAGEADPRRVLPTQDRTHYQSPWYGQAHRITPDGCHLHVERRALKGGLGTATRPRTMLELKAKD